MTLPRERHIDISPKLISESYEDIEFKSSDGLNLRGWLFPGSSEKLIILVAGFAQNRTNPFYYSVSLAQELVSQGYSVLMYDTRAYGQSEGTRIGYGVVEGKDVLGAVQFAVSKGFAAKKIGIIANSTGAISTLLVAEELKEVGALVLDSPAADFQPIIADRLWKEKFIPFPFHPTIFFFNKVLFGVDLAKIRPIDKIKLVPERKFLFLHAANDPSIPLKNSQLLLANSNKESKLVVFEDGEHIETYKKNPQLYRKEVFAFLEKELSF